MLTITEKFQPIRVVLVCQFARKDVQARISVTTNYRVSQVS